ncbi:hypothetical protein HY487_00355 [Candidatus Woesearchaeota archaeon]|nr:hypothetical protein [Candidatus Woesearchaeota archaeon]
MDTNGTYRGWLESHPVLHSLDKVVAKVHPFIHQASRPLDKDLLAKIGLHPSEKIFFYAGYHGDWASSIGALGCDVTYSDISPGLVEMMRHDPRSRHFSSTVIADGSTHPKEHSLYDWSVTFEPVPMVTHRTFYDSLVRALLNNKGGKLIFRSDKRDIYFKSMAMIAERYGIVVETSSPEIVSKRKFGFKKHPIKYTVHTLITSDTVRDEVLMDIFRTA